ncbi:membrane protein [Pontibacillus halophilus JSM 076056 = DSM 19796]|uniref:Membrane protein n=1 Tax=Pontibacillus halophilus JSM 076056 = DSM 19796 TaxID=1385510 RepID=A0A0A5GL69_9BACI|nr:DUF5412 family protein [Pontibacillus halophilus]KGX92749.1 membrane protein [Pontibacillus halophilus JSM 076056 = DSM 19796]
MKRGFNLLGTILSVACFLLTLLALYSTFNNGWFIPNQSYWLLVLSVTSILFGILGLKERVNYGLIKTVVTFSLSSLTTLALVMGIVFTSFFTMDKELITTTYSPNKSYEIDFYEIDGGAAASFGIIGELNGPFVFKKKIYLESNAEEANFNWIDEHTIVINSNTLDLTDKHYYYN